MYRRVETFHLFWWLWGSGFSFLASDYVLHISGLSFTDLLGKIIVTVSVILGFIVGLIATIRLHAMYKRLHENGSRKEVWKWNCIELAVFFLILLTMEFLLKHTPQDYKPKSINGWDE